MTRLQIRESTLKQLYGLASHCAYPGCTEHLIRRIDDHDIPVLNSRAAHICAASKNGPRYDDAMSDEDRRHFNNLLLLCLPHAEEIDLPSLVDRYPPDLLREWKSAAESGESGDTDLPSELLRRAELLVAGDYYDLSQAQLGGQGGQAPGAGGGGGAGVGPGAKGGDGGPGGMQVSFTATAQDLSGEVPVVVGLGGRPGVLGYPGECGGNTRFGTIVTPGAGRAVLSPIPDDIASKVTSSVTAALLTNHVEIANGLGYLNGAGWENYRVAQLPAPLGGYVAIWIDVMWSDLDAGTTIPLEVVVELITPSGPATFSERVELPLTVQKESDWRRMSVAYLFTGTLHDEGLHVFHVSTNASAHLDQHLRVVLEDDES
jgi:hypothetical protein